MSALKVGRSPRADIVVSDPSVSRNHAEITLHGEGRVTIVDSGSKFGTFVLRNGGWQKIMRSEVGMDEPIMLGKFRTTAGHLLRQAGRPRSEPAGGAELRRGDLNSAVRRLAAILAADVVGYSKMMREDEAGTLDALKACRRDLFDPLVQRYRGRIFKVIGDGLLAEFASVVDAVRCAVDIQSSNTGRSFGAGKQIRFRMGINIGDVIADAEDLYGDGVNIAARLESISPPGGLCISGPVYDQVKHKLLLDYEDLGEQTVKNIAEPMRVYRIQSSESGRRLVTEPV
jgi:class 3 adenylate cyclase